MVAVLIAAAAHPAAAAVAVEPLPLGLTGKPAAVSPRGVWLAITRQAAGGSEIVLVRRDGRAHRVLDMTFDSPPQVTVRDDGSAFVVTRWPFYVAAGSVSPVRYATVTWINVVAYPPTGNAIVVHTDTSLAAHYDLVRPSGERRLFGPPRGAGNGNVSFARDGSLVALAGWARLRDDPRFGVRSVWIASPDGTRSVRTRLPVVVQGLNFSADLRRAVGISLDGRKIVRYERRGRRLVPLPLRRTQRALTRVLLSGDGSTIATIAGREQVVHAGRWSGPLRRIERWGADVFATAALTDDGRLLATRTSGGLGEPETGGWVATRGAPVTARCTGSNAQLHAYGAVIVCETVGTTGVEPCSVPREERSRYEVVFREGTGYRLEQPGRADDPLSTRLSEDGRTALLETRACPDTAATTYVLRGP